MSDNPGERRRTGSIRPGKIELAPVKLAKLPPMVEGLAKRYGGVERFADKLERMLYGRNPLPNLMVRLGQPDPTALADAMAEFYKAMVDARGLFVYLKRGGTQDGPEFRGLMRIFRENGSATIQSYRRDLAGELDFLTDIAIRTNKVCLLSDGKVFWVDRLGKDAVVMTSEGWADAGEESVLVAPFSAGVMKAVGNDLTFGGVISPAKKTVLATAAFTMHLEDHLAARTDTLTGLTTRGEFSKVLRYMIRLYLANGTDTSIAMMDLDHFKRVNDDLGHDAGDRVLVSAANRALETFRTEDMVSRSSYPPNGSDGVVRDRPVYRLGGEELMVILAGADTLGGAIAADRFRRNLEGSSMLEQHPGRVVTVSIGVASISQAEWALKRGVASEVAYPEGVEARVEAIASTLTNMADRAMYEAKKTRNAVVMVSCDEGIGLSNVRFINDQD
jgi:GGDEF domain-containing protein